MKSDDTDARAGLESRSQNPQPLLEGAKFIIHFHPQRLKDLRGRMTPAMPADDFFDHTRQGESLAERGCLPHLYDQICDATRDRFFSQLAEHLGQLLCAVIIHNIGSSQPAPWVHAHVQRAIARETKTALRILELPRGDTKIEKHTADGVNFQFVENFVRVAKVRPPHPDAPAKLCQLLAHMLDGIRILIQGEDICAGPQKRFCVATAAAGPIDNERTSFRRKLLDDLIFKYRTVINRVLHIVRLLFVNYRICGEPDRPLRQQCVHNLKSNDPLTSQLHSRRADKWAFPPRAPASNVASSKSQNVRGRRRGRPRLSIQPFYKARPAKRDALVDPQPHAERESATGAGKPGDLAREHSRSIRPPSSSEQTPPAT